MINRTLQRPMFRIGGSAGTGITSGLSKPRQGYKGKGDASSQRVTGVTDNFEIMREKIGEYPKGDPYPTAEKYPYKASDFFMGLGQGILAQPGGQPIFQTIGKAAGLPLQNLTKAQMADWEVSQQNKRDEWKIDRENQLGQWKSDRDLMLALNKKATEEDLNAIEELIPYYMKTFNTDRGGAIKMIVEERRYSKSGRKTDEQTRTERIDFLEKSILGEPGASKKYIGNARDMATHLYKMQQGEYETVDPDDFVKGKPWVKSLDVSDQRREDGVVVEYKLSESGIKSFQGYEGKVFYDIRTGKLFRKQGNSLIVVEDINKED